MDGDIVAESAGGIKWRVPVAIVAAALMQTGTVIWWARGIEARLDATAIVMAEHAVRLNAIDVARGVTGERIAKVEQISADTLDLLRHMDTKLDRLEEHAR